jgi:hypothetical protein
MSGKQTEGKCDQIGCNGGWYMGCHHGRWCGQHTLAHMGSSDDCRPLMSESMLRLMREGFKPMIELADAFSPVTIAVVDLCRRVYDDFAEAMSNMYENAGRPYGDDEPDMWRWIREQFDTPCQ